MRMKRLLTGVISAALLGMTPIALAAAPAHAATYATQINATMSYTKIEAGRTFSISGSVQYNNGGTLASVPYGSGSVTLQRQEAGSSSWTTLETDTSGNSFYFYPLEATKNATYRLVYSGGSVNGNTYAPKTAEGKQQVTRKLDVKTKYGSLTVKGKVSPDFKNKKFKVEVKKGGWKTFKKVKTNRKGKFAVKLVGNRKGIKYRLVVPANKGYAKTTSGVITARAYRY